MAVLSVPSRFTYLPILPLSSTLNLTPGPTFTILAHTQTDAAISQVRSTAIGAPGAPSMTTNVGLGPRVASYTTIYVATSLSASSAAPEKPRPRDPVYGDLTWSYIVILCVPFVFLGLALYTNHRDRRRRVADEDIEMQSYKKYWFPWRELDPGEVPNEVSSSNPPAPNPDPERRRLSRKGGRHAWHPSRGEPMPPVTLYENPPSWGRRHSWWDVVAYPPCPAPLMPERKIQAAAAAADRHRRNDQIYGRTGSRRNAGPEDEDDLASADGADSDNDSTTANTGRFSPDIEAPKHRNNGRIDDVRNGDNTNNASPNPWNTQIPSYYGDFPCPVSPVSVSSPSKDTVAGPSSNNTSETKAEAKIQAQAQAQAQAKPQPRSQTEAQAPIRRRTERVRNRFDFPSSSSDEDAAGQPAEPQKQHSYYADPRTRAGKQPVKP